MFNTVLRGDAAPISIGEDSYIQELCVLHVTCEFPLIVEQNVSIAHQVTLHGSWIGKFSNIGMGSVIMEGVVVGERSIVAPGSVCPKGRTYPPDSYIVGNPARVDRELTDEELDMAITQYNYFLDFRDDFINPETIGPVKIDLD